MSKSKTILSAVCGTVLEYYDLLLYTHFLFILTPLFFPSQDPFVSTILGMGSYAAGFLMRPLGGIIFGHIGDRLGRKIALGLSIMLISIPTFIIGILPTYTQIGIAASIILVSCRLLQSFCVGGEATGASIFLVEHAPSGYASTMSSLLNVAGQLGSIIGAALGLICLKSFLPEWGWRVPFILGAVFGWLGYYIRLKIEETPDFIKVLNKKSVAALPLKEVLKKDKMGILRTMGTCAGVMAPFQMIFIYMGDVLRNKLHLPIDQVIYHNIQVMVVMALALLVMGYIADKVGFKRVMRWSLLGTILLTYPLFSFIQDTQDPSKVFLMQAMLSIITSGVTAPCCVFICDLFPTKERYSGCALGWSLGSILFAGLTPLLSVLFVQWTGDQRTPAFILMFCSILGLLALRDSKNKTMKKERSIKNAVVLDLKNLQKAS